MWSEKLQVRVLSEHAHASLPSFDGVWSEKLAQVRVLSEHAHASLLSFSFRKYNMFKKKSLEGKYTAKESAAFHTGKELSRSRMGASIKVT